MLPSFPDSGMVTCFGASYFVRSVLMLVMQFSLETELYRHGFYAFGEVVTESPTGEEIPLVFKPSKARSRTPIDRDFLSFQQLVHRLTVRHTQYVVPFHDGVAQLMQPAVRVVPSMGFVVDRRADMLAAADSAIRKPQSG